MASRAALALSPLVLVGAIGLAAAGLGGASGGVPVNTRAGIPARDAALVDRFGHLCPTLTPALLAAQLDQESGFDPAAVSPAGALGIAQFLPATYAAWGVNVDGAAVNTPLDPTNAIASAAVYDCTLASELAGVPGDPVANMLAAYNAGPYAVVTYRGVPPYAQTQAYVAAIEARAATYAAPMG